MKGLRDPVKSSFKGKDKAAHTLSETVPIQRTLASLHLSPGKASCNCVTCDQICEAADSQVALQDVRTRAGVRAVCWTPDGEALASGGDAGIIHVCDVPTGEVKVSLRGHTAKVWSIACSRDGLLLATASKDKTVRPSIAQIVVLTSCMASCNATSRWIALKLFVARFGCGALRVGRSFLCCTDTPTR